MTANRPGAPTPEGAFNQTEVLRICSIDDLGEGQASRFEVNGHKIALVRGHNEQCYAIGDTCSHADYSLSEGEVDLADCTIECWKHGALFSLLDGIPQSLPATRPVPVYPTKVEHRDIYVSLAPNSAERTSSSRRSRPGLDNRAAGAYDSAVSSDELGERSEGSC